MASTPGSTHQSQSSFRNAICLFDWWLVRTETQFQGKKSLGVSGTTSTQKQAVRVFSSAPIAKRVDIFTVETCDGVCILLKGLINGKRTVQNGFPAEVSKAFLFGFPTDWEQYDEKYCGEDSATEETADDKKHVSDNDGEEMEVQKGQLREVSENIANDTSNTADLEKSAADKTEGSNVPSIGVIRYTVRSKKLEGGQKKIVSSSSSEEKTVTPMPFIEETPKKKKHISHEDREEIQVPKHVPFEVCENIATDPSNVSILNLNAAAEAKGTNFYSTGFARGGRLKNLNSGQKKSEISIYSCSLNYEKNVSPGSGLVIGSISSEKAEVAGKSALHTVESIPINLSATEKNTLNERRITDLGLKADRKKSDTVPVVHKHLRKNVKNDWCDLGGGSVPFLSSDELEERVSANVAEKQDTDQAFNSKRVHNSQNAKTKEADAKRSTTGKKGKKKVSLPVSETDTEEERTAGKKGRKKGKKKLSLPLSETDTEEERTAGKKIKTKIIFEEQGILGAREEKAGKHIVSPECLSVGRSRSGRLLMPVLEFWRNQTPVYDKHRKLTGIQEQPIQAPARVLPGRGRKKKKAE